MNDQILLTDGSVNPTSKVGYGAYLALNSVDEQISRAMKCVKIKRFENTSSTKLELQTLLWALEETRSSSTIKTVYTDSQNIVGLLGRRIRFEKNDYYTKAGKLIANHELYRKFYDKVDALGIEIIKVKGHQPFSQKDKLLKLFTLVDQASRNALRADLGGTDCHSSERFFKD